MQAGGWSASRAYQIDVQSGRDWLYPGQAYLVVVVVVAVAVA